MTLSSNSYHKTHYKLYRWYRASLFTMTLDFSSVHVQSEERNNDIIIDPLDEEAPEAASQTIGNDFAVLIPGKGIDNPTADGKGDFEDKKCIPNAARLGMESNTKRRVPNMIKNENGEDFEHENENSTSTESQEIAEMAENENKHPFSSTIGKTESQEINRFKFIIVLILLGVAAISSTCVFIFITKAEEGRFEEKFYEDALKVLEAVRNSIDNTLIPLDALAVTLVSHASAQNSTWPFVTLEDFGVRIAKILPLTDAIFMGILPVVTPANRLLWENYSHANDGWVDESFDVQNTWELYNGPKNLTFDSEEAVQIHGIFGPLDTNISRMMLPQWQMFPNIPNGIPPYNFDWLDVTIPEAPLECYATHRSVLSDPYLIPEPEDPAIVLESESWIEWLRPFVAADEEPYEPVMDIFYPIIDNVSRVKVVGSDDYDAKNNTLVGLAVVTAYWRNVIRNVLRPGSNGIMVVFNNTCAKSFTYQINGPDVIFIGVNDKHDTKYDDLRVSANVTELEALSSTKSVYSGAPISESYCPYTLHLYPTDVMKADHTSKNGTIYAIMTLFVVLSLAIVFITYDCKMERRQKKVLSSATRSSEIVSSLFPASVQDQLYPIHSNDKRSTVLLSAKAKDDGVDATPIIGGAIAQLYPDTTVMFADIKGFTEWSSNRQPTHVFHLLETLYGAFDVLAKSYGIFKVETIGDTYVAVVGLPSPHKQHAVVMVRFAKKCLSKMTAVVRNLEAALGPGTAELSLRIGLNSGPTTAGVLRGEKARFQLFGDTVNTASRMESNGESNRIHISESTAKLIENSGKGHWLTLRENTIEVKGKGEMQTYWCDPTKNSSDVQSTSPSNLIDCDNFSC